MLTENFPNPQNTESPQNMENLQNNEGPPPAPKVDSSLSFLIIKAMGLIILFLVVVSFAMAYQNIKFNRIINDDMPVSRHKTYPTPTLEPQPSSLPTTRPLDRESCTSDSDCGINSCNCKGVRKDSIPDNTCGVFCDEIPFCNQGVCDEYVKHNGDGKPCNSRMDCDLMGYCDGEGKSAVCYQHACIDGICQWEAAQ